MTLYSAAKWRTARLTRYSYRRAMAVGIVLSSISLFMSSVRSIPLVSYATRRDVGLLFLLMAIAVLVPTLWSRFHLGHRRPSLQLYVEDRELISFHWTPLPEWLPTFALVRGRGREKTAPRIPRREALMELQRWISEAQTFGYRQVRLDSPLFVTRVASGAVVPRAALRRFVDEIAMLPAVSSVEIGTPQALTAGRAMSYRLFWPSAARNVCREKDGRILAGGIVIHLATRGDPGAKAAGRA